MAKNFLARSPFISVIFHLLIIIIFFVTSQTFNFYIYTPIYSNLFNTDPQLEMHNKTEFWINIKK